MDIKEKNIDTIPRRKNWIRDFMTCRRVLNIMVFLGFMVNYMLRVNLTFAIVDMVINITDTKPTMDIPIDIPKNNRSIRSIPESEFMEAFPDVGIAPAEDEEENIRNLRKKNLEGKKIVAAKKPVVSNMPKFNSSTFGKSNFQSFSNGTGGKTQFIGGQVGSSGAKSFQSVSSFSSGGFSTPVGNSKSFNSTGFSSSSQPGGGFQSSGFQQKFTSGAMESEVIQKSISGLNSQFQASGTGESEVMQKKSISGLNSQIQASGAEESEVMQKKSVSDLNSQIQASSSSDPMQKSPKNTQQGSNNDEVSSANDESADSQNIPNKTLQDDTSGNGSDDVESNSKLGVAPNMLDNSNNQSTNTNQDGSSKLDDSIIGEENAGNQHILFTKDSDKQLPPVEDSKLADEAVSDNVNSSTLPSGFFFVNDTKDLDVNNGTYVQDRIRRFNWSEAQQGILIGSFFWGYICTELPGGRLAELIGARRVFGYATLGASVVTLLTPLSAKIHFLFAVIIRILLGFFLGPTWPSTLPLAAKWIPPDERGKFLSNMMGSTLGAGFTLPLCGLIIAHFSWEYVFYITGLLGFVWSIVWFLLVFETPADHPRITPEERWYIETKLEIRPSKDSKTYSNEEKQTSQGLIVANQAAHDFGSSDNEQKTNDDYNRNYSTFAHTNGKANGTSDTRTEALQDKKSSLEYSTDSETESSLKVPNSTETNIVLTPNGQAAKPVAQNQSSHANAPWVHILTSVPVWAFVLTHGASVFGYNTITNQLPTYMKYILKYNIKQNGVLSALPYIGKYIAALIGGSIADKLLHSPRFSKNFVRKLFTSIGVMIPGFLMILQIFVGDHKVVSIFVFTAALTANGCVTGGYLGNSLDIAPDYSGTVFGLANMFSGLSGAVSAIIVGYLTDHNQVYGQWQKVFLIVAITYLVGSLLFLTFGSTEVQWWNSSKAQKKKTEMGGDLNEETVILQSGRRRSSVSSILRSYTEDELASQSNYSSGKDSTPNTRKKRRRKNITSEESESFDSSKHRKHSKSEYPTTKTSERLVKTKLPDSDTMSSDYKDKSKSQDLSADQTKIKLRKKRPEKYHEDYSLNYKKRISYKQAIENGSQSDYSYDSENKTHLKTSKQKQKANEIEIESSLDDSKKTRSKKSKSENHDETIQRISSDSETNSESKKTIKKHKIRDRQKYSDDDSMSEGSERKSRRHRSKHVKSQASKDESENGHSNSSIKKSNDAKKQRKKIAFNIDTKFNDTQDDDSSIGESSDKTNKKSAKSIQKDCIEPSTSITLNQNEINDNESLQSKDKSNKTSKKRFDLKLPKLPATLKSSLNSPL